MIESLALSQDVRDILGLRQGLEVPQTNIIVTDFSEIPKGCLVVTAKLHPGTADDLYDNNVCLGESLWIAFERSQGNNNKDFLIYFMDTLENLNEKLSYFLRNTEEEDKDKLLNVITSIPVDELTFIYEKVLAESNGSREDKIWMFLRLLSKSEKCQNGIKLFWEVIGESFNKKYESLKSEFAKCGLVREDSLGRCECIIAFNRRDYTDSVTREIVSTILHPSGYQKFWFEDITLIFRGRESLFEVDGIDSFTVLEAADGKKVHCFRFIDLKGFSDRNAAVDNEISHIKKVITEHHSNKAIFRISTIYAGDADRIVCGLLAGIDQELEVYFLYTDWDRYLDCCHKEANGGGWWITVDKVGWPESYEFAKNKLQDRARLFEDVLNANPSKGKLTLVGSYDAACGLEPPAPDVRRWSSRPTKFEEIDAVLHDKHIVYPEPLNRMIADMASKDKGKMVEKKQGQASTMSIF